MYKISCLYSKVRINHFSLVICAFLFLGYFHGQGWQVLVSNLGMPGLDFGCLLCIVGVSQKYFQGTKIYTCYPCIIAPNSQDLSLLMQWKKVGLIFAYRQVFTKPDKFTWPSIGFNQG